MSRRLLAVSGLAGFLVFVGAYTEHRVYQKNADVRVGMLDPRTVELKPAPIRRDWILDGNPQATAGVMGRTQDGSTDFIVWRVSAGRFNWYYDFDETITILDGDVYLTDGANAAPGNKAERHLGPGDVIFFHNGSTATWRVPDHVRKIATVKHPLPAPIASLYRFAKTIRAWMSPEPAQASSL